ncbi:unnamed protein product [Hyaloperonospora brassicae]|uniref:Fungal lipase-type domain-containing protein n=1 Tax=Hyaloperonospora brassicae TaxID=162125 RepID=A0AAV0UK54_HYABA|nr:unnamed protein product [Hyaloperonospora brassicae]
MLRPSGRLLRQRLPVGIRATSRSSKQISKRLRMDGRLGEKLRAAVKDLSLEMLPALKVLSESIGMLRQSPALRRWSASDWLVGLSVLAQHKTKQRRTGERHDDELRTTPVTVDQELLSKLLRYVRVCDAVYASSMDAFCTEAAVSRDCIVWAHPGGVVSPKCVILVDHDHKELVLAARGTASLMDFCTDLCLYNEPFQNGQGHRGMVHAATWLVHHLRSDLRELSHRYQDYRVVATGHSLGAAVAALSAMQLREEFPDIHCYAFGTPACVTEELATGTYDFVTTVVNGYDCVPRLHQHSLMKLQEEVRRFDWRSVLKQMVAEEIHKHKAAMEKHQREKIDEMHRALQTMNFLQLKEHTNSATVKLGEVKRAASENMMEFAHDVDTLLSGKLGATFSVFKTDRHLLDHVSFIKNYTKLEDVKKGDFAWWKYVDESVASVERLLPAVKKPEELERVLVELREVLQKTTMISGKLLTLDGTHGDATESTSLQIFHSRVNDIISKTSAALKMSVSEQVSKVSSVVTSNVRHCVGTIKEETEALGTVVQDEFVEVAGMISRNLPFTIDAKSRSALENRSPEQYDKSHADEVLVDADPLQGVNGEIEEKIEDKWEEVQEDQKKREEDDELRHDPLFPPGRILYLNSSTSRPTQDSAGDDRKVQRDHEVRDVMDFVEVATDEFSRVVLSNRMLLDHLCTDYERVLQCQAKKLESTPSSTTSAPQP